MSNIAAKRAADDDLDLAMQDGSSASTPATPPNQGFSSELSPPDSQRLTAGQNPPSPFTPSGGAGSVLTAPPNKAAAAAANTSKKMPPSTSLNANGKRNWENNGLDADTGYKWEREEDAPGWTWLNQKAREDSAKAWTQVVEKDRKIGNKYGDMLLSVK